MIIRNYFKIGKNAKPKNFLKALAREKNYNSENTKKNQDLLRGAAEAFAAGRPENIQTAIMNAHIVRYYNYPLIIPSALFKVTEKSEDKLAAISVALEMAPDKQAVLDKAIKNAASVGGDAFSSLLLKSKAYEFEKLPEQNGETILRETLDLALQKGYGGEDLFLSLLNTGLAKMAEADKERALSNTLNVAIASKCSESFAALLLKLGADANAKIDGHPGGILVTATCSRSPITVIELLHKNGTSFGDAETMMHSQGYTKDDIDRLKFYQKKIEGGEPAAAAVEAVTKAVAAVEQSPAADQGDVRDILLQILEQVKELTEAVKADKSEMPAAPAQKKTRRPDNYPSL